MFTATRVAEEIDAYKRRVDELFRDLRGWIIQRRPDAVFNETPVELAEEDTGPYELHSLDVALPGLPAVRFLPMGIFMVGAHGRVDVWSRLGREILVWLEAGGPALTTTMSAGDAPEEIISRPLFQNAKEGWSWADARRNEVVALDADVLWKHVLGPLTQ